jgi:hypothetical protein
MATHVASQSCDGQQNKECSGVSYANAVLNFKTLDSNKENINAASTSPVSVDTAGWETQSKTKPSSQSKISKPQSSYASASKTTNNGEEFPLISSSCPKNIRQLPAKPEKDTVASKQRTEPEVKVKDHNSASAKEAKVEEVVDKKKFVEAPLPKINPWAINRNAASILKGKLPAEAKQVVPSVAPSVSSEKRVLQPHQQDTVGEFFLFFIIIHMSMFDHVFYLCMQSNSIS